MNVYSALPLQDVELRFMVEDDKPSMHMRIELRSGRRVRVHFVHPAPPSPTENETARERDAELMRVAREVAAAREPVVVAGDLNDVAWSPTTRLFRKVSGLRDPRVGRGMFNTFHAQLPFMRFPLDHVFVSEHFDLVTMRRLSAIGSDHFPFLAEFRLRDTDELPHAADEGDGGLEAEPDDFVERDRIIAKVRPDSAPPQARDRGHD